MTEQPRHPRHDDEGEKLEKESIPEDRSHIDPHYLEHHDAAEILTDLREKQMRPHKFPT